MEFHTHTCIARSLALSLSPSASWSWNTREQQRRATEWTNKATGGKTKSSTQLTCFPLHFVAMQCRFHFFSLHIVKPQKSGNGHDKTGRGNGCDKSRHTENIYICGWISIEYITQINAINISHNQKHTHTHTPHAKWFDISFMCMIRCFASICIASFGRFCLLLLLLSSFCYFNWMHFQLYLKSSFFDFRWFFFLFIFFLLRRRCRWWAEE